VLAKHLDDALSARNWTKTKLAEKAAYDERTIRNVLDGHSAKYETYAAICTALGLNIEDLNGQSRVCAPPPEDGLAAQDPNKQVLILCFNRALAEYFQRLFEQTANVTCLNFHQWGSQRNGVRFKEAEDEEAFGERLLQRLQHGEGDAHKYDTVFIDEAQDFSKS
jgi:DNA-binding Xre family transcriptional regulator